MSGCCYIGTLCDAESLTGRRLLRVAAIPNAIMDFIDRQSNVEMSSNLFTSKSDAQ